MSAPSSSGPLLIANDLCKSFDRGRVPALNGVSCEIWAGEAVALTGPSGCGKTTLLNLLCGLLRPDAGTVHFAGNAPASRGAWARFRAREIGIVLQDHHLLPTLSALENVELPMLGQLGPARRRRERARELLHQVALADLANRRPGELSGGQRQRVAIARSLANHPVLLLADEPTGNLDSTTTTHTLDLLQSLRRSEGLTLVVVTHDPQVAAICGRHLHLRDGRIEREAFASAEREPREAAPAGGVP